MSKYKKLLIALFVALTFQFLLVASVLAVGVGVKPSFFDLEVVKGQEQVAKMVVFNVSQEAALFKVYPDELKEWILVEPDNFRLEASENKEVTIIIKAKDEGRQATNLSVVASPLDKRLFNADSGVKIPLRLEVKPGPGGLLSNFYVFMALWLGFSLILICLVIYIVLKLRKKTWKEKVIDKVEDTFHPKKHWWE